MEFRLLGPLEVQVNGTAVEVGSPKHRSLLAALLLQPGKPVSLGEIIEAVWGDDQPSDPRRAVQIYVARLRTQLATAGFGPLIATASHGYLIAIDPATVDVWRFEEAWERAQRAAEAGDEEAEAAGLAEALAEWRGEALVDVPSDVLHRDAVPRLAEQRLLVLDRRIALDLRRGRRAELVGELVTLTAQYPLRERFWAQLMTALEGSGRRADALAAYQTMRQHFAAELGIDPSDELQRLHASILLGTDRWEIAADRRGIGTERWEIGADHRGIGTERWEIAADRRGVGADRQEIGADRQEIGADRRGIGADRRENGRSVADADPPALPTALPPVPLPAVPRQLPPSDRWFSGRAAELARLDRLLDVRDAVVIGAITGTAGVGKTALAVQWARRVADRFPDGQLWVNLRGYDPRQPVPPGQALTRFLRALGVPGARIPLDVEDQSALYRSLMDGRRMLVLLDNANSAEQVRPLVPGSPGHLVLVTSRDDLAALVARDGAERLRLGLLARGEATELLRRLLGGSHLESVARLAELCARLPLALRLAAERVALGGRSLPELIDELAGERRLDTLAAGGDSYTAARAVFSWSYQALPPDAARLFRVLALHPGADWDAPAAAALLGTSTVDGPLSTLTASHLVDERDGRYSMHDLLRAYAAELSAATCDNAGDDAVPVERLLRHYLYAAATAMDLAYPHERDRRPRIPSAGTPVPQPMASVADALAWLEAERANLLAIAAHSGEYAIKLSAILYRHLVTRALNSEATIIHRYAHSAAIAAGDRSGEAQARLGLGTVHWLLAQYPDALADYRAALAAYQEIGDLVGEAIVSSSIGATEWMLGHTDDAVRSYEHALALARTIGDRVTASRTLNSLALVHSRYGRDDEALANYREALAIAVELGDRSTEANLLNGIAYVHKRQGRDQEAFDEYQRALAIAEEIGDRNFELKSIGALGSLRVQWGQYDVAHQLFRRALALAREVGDRTREADVHQEFGTLYLRQKRYDESGRHLRRALSLARETAYGAIEASVLNGLGELASALGRTGEARARFQSALETARTIHDREAETRALDALSRLDP